MDGISRISPRTTQSQPEEVPAEPQENSTSISLSKDHYELHGKGSTGEFIGTSSGQTPRKATRLTANSATVPAPPASTANSGNTAPAGAPDATPTSTSAFSVSGAYAMLTNQLKTLESQKRQLTSKIVEVGDRLAKAELALQNAMAIAASTHGKGGQVELAVQKMKEVEALQSELAALQSQLETVDVEIKETIERMQKLNNTNGEMQKI